MSKRISAIALLVALLFMLVFPVAAQEPTDLPEPEATEAAPVITDQGGVTVVQPEDGGGGVVVVQQPAPAEQDAPADDQMDWGELLAIILSVAAAAGTMVGILLKPTTREVVRGGVEKAEGFTWVFSAAFSDVVEAFGGRKDVETSANPAKLAAALRDRDMNVLINKQVDFEAVIREYQNSL